MSQINNPFVIFTIIVVLFVSLFTFVTIDVVVTQIEGNEFQESMNCNNYKIKSSDCLEKLSLKECLDVFNYYEKVCKNNTIEVEQ